MGKDYFRMIPTVEYSSLAGDNQNKIAINILRRVKTRADLLTDYALFYNYETEEGDTAELISNKIYGTPKYHWVVCLMNDVVDPLFDFALSSQQFESYLKGKYGSIERAEGVRAALHSPGAGPPLYDIYSSNRVQSARPSNSPIWWDLGGGKTTRISVQTDDHTLFQNIGPGDMVEILVPGEYYTPDSIHYRKLSYVRHQKVLEVYTDVSDSLTKEQGGFSGWTPGTDANGLPIQIIDTNGAHHQVVITDLDSSGFLEWGNSALGGGTGLGDKVILASQIHHFEKDYYNESNGYLVANNVHITAAEAMATPSYDIGGLQGGEKRLITNAEWERQENDNKSTVYLLKPDYLQEFVEEFERLIQG